MYSTEAYTLGHARSVSMYSDVVVWGSHCHQHNFDMRLTDWRRPAMLFARQCGSCVDCLNLLALPNYLACAVSRTGSHTHACPCRWYADQPDIASILPDDAQRWTEHFAALSYGDPLFSLALSPLLSRHSPLPVQVVQCAGHFPSRELNAVG